jgi:branched-chain amino acid transport system ATP-binding protein
MHGRAGELMLELRGIEAGYGGTKVLKGIDLIVPEGAVVALLGANGAGKTTMLRVAAGLLRPARGQLIVDGTDCTGHPPHRLVDAGVCHVPEGRGVFPNLTVRENLQVQSKPGEEAAGIERAVSVFKRLGERLNQPAGTMSGGEQQMLALARAYIRRPRFVLLDEVSMGLAPNVVDDIFEFLTLLAKEGSSLLLVEQYVTRALAIADYVYLLGRGEVSFGGEPAELEGEDLFDQYMGTHLG